VGFLKPHLPFCAPRKYWDLYKTDQFQLPAFRRAPEGAPAYAPTAFGELRNYKDVPDKGEIPEDLQRKLIHGYHAAISYMDAQVGKVLDALDASPLKDNTVIVLWGDHGWHLGDHGMWCKHSNYEQATRIPVIVSVPGKAQGVSTKALIESVDIYPTLCDLSGIQIPKSLDGRSFAKVLGDPAASHRDHTIQVYPRSKEGVGQVLGRSIRTQRYRFVEWKGWGDKEQQVDLELYDYQNDPLETQNLAKQQPDVVAQLRSLLDTHPAAKPQVKAADASGATVDPKKAEREGLFTKKDADSDGFLTHSEFMAGQKDPDQARERFRKFDANGDGRLSRKEFVSSGRTGD